MNPSIELRIRSMLRAMTEVVLPALDARDALAQEQARLVVGHLHALSLQHRHATRCEAVERDALRCLARELSASACGGPRTRAAADALAASDDDDVASAIDRLISAASEDGTPACRAAITERTLAHAKAAALRARSWFAAMGFGGDPAALPSIETMLARSGAALEREP